MAIGLDNLKIELIDPAGQVGLERKVALSVGDNNRSKQLEIDRPGAGEDECPRCRVTQHRGVLTVRHPARVLGHVAPRLVLWRQSQRQRKWDLGAYRRKGVEQQSAVALADLTVVVQVVRRVVT